VQAYNIKISINNNKLNVIDTSTEQYRIQVEVGVAGVGTCAYYKSLVSGHILIENKKKYRYNFYKNNIILHTTIYLVKYDNKQIYRCRGKRILPTVKIFCIKIKCVVFLFFYSVAVVLASITAVGSCKSKTPIIGMSSRTYKWHIYSYF